MSCKDTLACKTTILEHVGMGRTGLLRLKEQLSLIFDSHRIQTNETRRRILIECNLQPILVTSPVHELSFVLSQEDLAVTENPPRRSKHRSSRSTPRPSA